MQGVGEEEKQVVEPHQEVAVKDSAGDPQTVLPMPRFVVSGASVRLQTNLMEM